MMSEVPPSSSSAAAAAAAEAEVMELSEAAPASSSVFSLSQPFSAGVERDVRVLVTRVVALFDELEGLRFQHFLDIWKDMRFPLIFCGRQYARELYELTEEVLACAKRRALAPESQPVRAAAVYLTYALYFRQPLRPRIKVRLTLPELRDVSEFIDRCREEQHWDLVYVWARLLQDHAFEFVACETLLGPEIALLGQDSGLRGHRSQDEPYTGRANPLKSDDFQSALDRLAGLHSKYQGMKDALSGLGSTSGRVDLDPSLNFTSAAFPEQVQFIVENFHDHAKLSRSGLLGDDRGEYLADEAAIVGDADGGNDGGGSIGQRRRLIREQAYSKEEITKRQRDVRKFGRRSSSSGAEEAQHQQNEEVAAAAWEGEESASSAGGAAVSEAASPRMRRKVGQKRRKKGRSKGGRYVSSTYGQKTSADDGITFDLEACEKSLFDDEKEETKSAKMSSEKPSKKRKKSKPSLEKEKESPKKRRKASGYSTADTDKDVKSVPGVKKRHGKEKRKWVPAAPADVDAAIEAVVAGTEAQSGQIWTEEGDQVQSVIEAVVAEDGTLQPVYDRAYGKEAVAAAASGEIRVADFVLRNYGGSDAEGGEEATAAGKKTRKGKGVGKRSKRKK